MNLTLYFRLIISHIFQSMLSNVSSNPLSYTKTLFYCMRIYCKDGFNVSLQIHNGNYCSSENGYRVFGYTWETVEFGFTSIHEPLLSEHAEDPDDTTKTVGSVPISVMEEIMTKHGGIDWEATLSVENCKKFTNNCISYDTTLLLPISIISYL